MTGVDATSALLPLVAAARKEGLVTVHRRLVPLLAPIVADDGTVAGFYAPQRWCAHGRRLGPIYIHPDYRRRGLVLALYARERGLLVACVPDGNVASIALHARAGFERWRRYADGWWWRRL